MTGRDLIIYILKNGLEDKPVFEDGKFIGFVTTEEAAVKKQVGQATILAWVDLGFVESVTVKPDIYIPVDQL